MNQVSKLPRYNGTLMAGVNLEREKENKWGYHSTLAALTLIIYYLYKCGKFPRKKNPFQITKFYERQRKDLLKCSRTFYFSTWHLQKLIIQHNMCWRCLDYGITNQYSIQAERKVRYCEQTCIKLFFEFFLQTSKQSVYQCVCVWLKREFQGVARMMSSIDAKGLENMLLQWTKRTWSHNTF